MHCNFDLQVGGAWCQSCPWATTHQLDRRDEAEKEMKKGNMRQVRVSACVHLRANKYQLWPSVPSHFCQLHKQLSSFHWGLSATPITTVSHLMIQQAVLLYCWNQDLSINMFLAYLSMGLIYRAVQWKRLQGDPVSTAVLPPSSVSVLEGQKQLIWHTGVTQAQVSEASQVVHHAGDVGVEVDMYWTREESLQVQRWDIAPGGRKAALRLWQGRQQLDSLQFKGFKKQIKKF